MPFEYVNDWSYVIYSIPFECVVCDNRVGCFQFYQYIVVFIIPLVCKPTVPVFSLRRSGQLKHSLLVRLHQQTQTITRLILWMFIIIRLSLRHFVVSRWPKQLWRSLSERILTLIACHSVGRSIQWMSKENVFWFKLDSSCFAPCVVHLAYVEHCHNAHGTL